MISHVYGCNIFENYISLDSLDLSSSACKLSSELYVEFSGSGSSRVQFSWKFLLIIPNIYPWNTPNVVKTMTNYISLERFFQVLSKEILFRAKIVDIFDLIHIQPPQLGLNTLGGSHNGFAPICPTFFHQKP